MNSAKAMSACEGQKRRSRDINYRPEIDGLRAIAVLAVVMYHFDVPGVTGGFAGVDVFFVISGFLIGGLLWQELEQTGRVAYGRFLLRRIRRLAPAYFVMAGASIVAGWALLLPYEFEAFGEEIISASVYLSNVYFWSEVGYFDQLGDQRVLLHTWSLSVEEQFYLVLPILLILMSRFPGLVPWILAALGTASLVACVAFTPTSQVTTFYLFPFRAWELLSGVLLALVGRRRKTDWQIGGWASLVGLGLVLLAVFGLDASGAFPGWQAMIPVAGTLLLIANGKQDNLVNRCLRTRPFLFFGVISYSLYLWHWPIITLAAYSNGGDLSGPIRFAIAFSSIGLAYLSYRFVETPVRSGYAQPRSLVMGFGLASALTCAIGALIIVKDGVIDRFPPQYHPIILAASDFYQDRSRCDTPQDGLFQNLLVCRVGPDGPPRVLMWGDSHGRALKDGFEEAARVAGISGLVIWLNGCPPVIGLTKEDRVNAGYAIDVCADFNAQVGEAIKLHASLESVVLVGRWTYYAQGRGVGRDDRNWVNLIPYDLPETVKPSNEELLAGALDATLRLAEGAGRRLHVFRQIPEIQNFSAREAAWLLVNGKLSLEELQARVAFTPKDDLEERNREFDEILRNLGAPVIDPWPNFCDPEGCRAFRDGQFLYLDNNHVTMTTSRALADVFGPVFEQLRD